MQGPVLAERPGPPGDRHPACPTRTRTIESDRKSRRLGELVILFPTGITCVSLASVEKVQSGAFARSRGDFVRLRPARMCLALLPASRLQWVQLQTPTEPLVVPPLLRRRWVTCAGVSRCAHEVRPGLQPATGKSAAVGKQPNSSSGQLWPARSPHSRSTAYALPRASKSPIQIVAITFQALVPTTASEILETRSGQ